jgi:hypothetical protein
MKPQHNSKKGFAIASFVLSLVGLLMFGLPLGIIAVIFGGISWNENGLAKAGTIIGAFDILAVILFLSQF